MKKIFEDWKAYSEKCTDSNDKDGTAVVKKVGSDEVESCHATKEKAEDAVKARYANYKNESLDEVSTMGGGNIAGHVDPKKELDELLSTSTQVGGVRIKIIPTDKGEHDGHVERSNYQGLKNVMETTKAP